MKNKRSEIKWRVIGILGKAVIDFLFTTISIKYKGLDNIKQIISSKKFILAFWHSRILAVSYIFQRFGSAILVSPSDDGEIIARILQRQGHETIRGSTTRGGLRAMSKLIKILKKSVCPAGIVPDGPQGPQFKVQSGVIILAKKTGYPIIPISYSAKKMKVFSSWDQFILPMPFTDCLVIYGKPVYVSEDADKIGEEECRKILENELNRITVEAENHYTSI
ncbi:Kdo2-lipid IVA 3' secondary acyltransferase [Candidatus Magnetomoraceae bacterium gMMP-15]